ncbi:MAG: hypothetical protein JRI97_06495 [Deltaproteobacteria bacterium]|nr:hypothetical protein [Deltaproteobacteria bacterium]
MKEQKGITLSKVQLLLAEKRTSLAALRTGLAVVALPLAIATALIATSRYYDILGVAYLFVPLVLVCAALLLLGLHLTFLSVARLHREDRMIQAIKKNNDWLTEVMD